jgi:hypothetical protein
MFLTKKVPEYETWLKKAYSPVYDQSNLVIRNQIQSEKEETKDEREDTRGKIR